MTLLDRTIVLLLLSVRCTTVSNYWGIIEYAPLNIYLVQHHTGHTTLLLPLYVRCCTVVYRMDRHRSYEHIPGIHDTSII